MKKIVILISLLFFILAGCAELAEHNRKEQELIRESRQFVQKYSTDKIKEAVSKKQLLVGMNKAEVWAVKGRPRDINKTTGYWGVHEQWIYGYGSYDKMYLYFENDILTSWQD